MSELVLYSYRRCPFAMRVRFTLHEKGIAFTLKEEDLKNFSPALRAMHPEAKVPLLVHGDFVLYESAIITEYLDEAFPAVPLMPKGAEARARNRIWTYWCNHLFKRNVDRLKYGTSRFPEAECVGVEAKIQAHLTTLEEGLAKSEWLGGPAFSLADIHVYPFCRQLFGIKPLPPSLVVPPRLAEWMERVGSRTAFQKTLAA